MYCESALSQAEMMAQDQAGDGFVVDQMLVGLPGSQLRGKAWSITQRRSRPERPVDARELELLLGRALRLAVNKLSGVNDPGWVLVDAAPVSLEVDGRRVTNPVGFRGRALSATVFAALTRVEVIETWRRIAKTLRFSALTLSAAPLAVTATLSEPEGLLVDVGGGSTDLTWWRFGRPLVLASVPVGGDSLTLSLLHRWGLTSDKAERLKRSYVGGELSESAKAQVLDAMVPALRIWLEQTELELAEMNEQVDEPLPQRLFLLGGGSALPEMLEAARTLAWSSLLQFERYPQIDWLKPTDVQGLVNRTDRALNMDDVTSMALAAWASKLHWPADQPSRILSALSHAHGSGG
jgi:cell division protein FtsA